MRPHRPALSPLRRCRNPPPSESGFVAFQGVYEAVAERREQVVFDVVGRAQVASVGVYLDENILNAVFYQFPVAGEL